MKDDLIRELMSGISDKHVEKYAKFAAEKEALAQDGKTPVRDAENASEGRRGAFLATGEVQTNDPAPAGDRFGVRERKSGGFQSIWKAAAVIAAVVVFVVAGIALGIRFSKGPSSQIDPTPIPTFLPTDDPLQTDAPPTDVISTETPATDLPSTASPADNILTMDAYLARGNKAGVIWDRVDLDGVSADIYGDNWDRVVNGPGQELMVLGWAASSQEIVAFGYVIDDGEPVLSGSFKRELEESLLKMAASSGCDYANGYYIYVPVGSLEGSHKLTIVCQVADGTVFKLTASGGNDVEFYYSSSGSGNSD